MQHQAIEQKLYSHIAFFIIKAGFNQSDYQEFLNNQKLVLVLCFLMKSMILVLIQRIFKDQQ